MLKQLRLSLAWIALVGLVCGPTPLLAQSDQPLSAEALDTLLAPIALYPDPLLAQILPASTVPGDVVMAYRYVASNKDVNKIDEQPWEESVKALARYPEVLKMMDEKLDWTTELGEAFIAQPEDVFNSVQRLREKARDVGNLKDNPQQVIVVEKEVIKIMPADPQVVYVPQYQPEVVYVQQPASVVAPIITFGAGLALGAWIHNEVNWHNHNVYYHNNGWNNHYHGGGNYYGGNNNININNSNNINIGNGNGNNGSVWKPQNKPRPTPYGTGNGNNGIANGNRPAGGNNSKWPTNGNGQLGGTKPSNKQTQLPATGNGRPSGTGAQQKPSTMPAKPQAKPSQRIQERPTTRPAQPSTSHGQQQTPRFASEGTKQRQANMGNRSAPANRQAAGNRGGGAGGGGGRLQR